MTISTPSATSQTAEDASEQTRTGTSATVLWLLWPTPSREMSVVPLFPSSPWVYVGHSDNCQGPIGELLLVAGRHNMRPNHLHLMIEAPGFRKLTTAWYPAGDEWLESDAVFGTQEVPCGGKVPRSDLRWQVIEPSRRNTRKSRTKQRHARRASAQAARTS